MKSSLFLNVFFIFLAGCRSAATSHDPIVLPNGIHIHLDRSQVRVPAVALLRSGWLEQAVCTPQTRTHESIFALLAAPSELHAALLAVGGTPGAPGIPERVDAPARPPTGSLIRIDMDHEGLVHRLQDLIFDDRTGETLQGEFVFAGSKIVEWEGQARYLADDEGSAVGLVTFGDELIGYSESRSASIEHARPIFRPNAALLPPPGSEVVLCFTVCPEDEG